jgi:hypothetical protein
LGKPPLTENAIDKTSTVEHCEYSKKEENSKKEVHKNYM